MNNELNILHPTSVWTEIAYHCVSILIFFFLFYIKIKVDKLHVYFFFVFYTLFVIAIACIQINIFANGTEFVSRFLHWDVDVYNYDSIYYGGCVYAFLYLFAMPTNIYERKK